jgi:hypothetical protein
MVDVTEYTPLESKVTSIEWIEVLIFQFFYLMIHFSIT